jgi:stage IV sporulation protein FB
MRRFGVDSHIVLYSFGGLAVPRSARRGQLNWTSQIMISLAGPFAGFLFGGIVLGIVYASGGIVYLAKIFDFLPIPMAYVFVGGRVGNMLNDAIWITIWINTFWGLINLLPVFPLDGGHVSQQLFIRFDPWNGVRNALWLSVVTGAILAIGGIAFFDNLYMTFLFGILALQSYQIIQGGVGPRF